MRLAEFAEINPRVPVKKGEEYPCVMMEDVTPGRRYVSADKCRPYKGGSIFQVGDTLFARITPCLENGKIAQFVGIDREMGFGSTEFFVFRHREGVSDPGYLFYLAFSDIVRKPAEKSMFGASGRQRADLNVVQDLEVPAPPLSTQRKIAAILSADDDLIENNTRRIKILEEMGRLIYREWFVHFRFPGHERVRMVDLPLGRTPEGWPVTRFSDAVEINPILPVNRDEEKPYVEMAGLSTTSMVINPKGTRTGNSGAKFQNRDVLFPRITPSVENGKGGFVQFLPYGAVGLGSTEFIVFRSKDLCPEYIYFLSREADFRENAAKSMIGASGRQRVQEGCFDNYLLARPPKPLLDAFSNGVSPIFRLIHRLADKNTKLRLTRDLLLPRLFSGEVDVENLEIRVE